MSAFVGEMAYWVPLSMIVWGLIWFVARSRRASGNDAAFNAREISSWPLTLVLATSAALGLSFAGIYAALDEGSWTRVVAVGAAAGLVVGLAPRLWARFVRPASPPSEQSSRSAQVNE